MINGATCAASKDTNQQTGIYDTTVWWLPYYKSEVKEKANVPFYFGGWFVGFGEKGFKTVINKIHSLPSGTSVVWGADEARMSAGPGYDNLARDLFPEQWAEFQKVAKERGVVLSSTGYAPMYGDSVEPAEGPIASRVETGSPRQPSDVILEWKPPKKDVEIFEYWEVREWPIYILDGRESGRGPCGFLDTLKALRECKEGSRLHIVWSDGYEPPGISMFLMEFREVVATKRFRLAVERKKDAWPRKNISEARFFFEWRNFRSVATPHEEVVYLIDGKLAGIGDAGFDVVLNRLRQLPKGQDIAYPQYHLGRGAIESIPDMKQVDSYVRQFEAKDPVPFEKRRKEFDDLIKQKHFAVGRDSITSGSDASIYEYEEAPAFLKSLLSFATIVRDGAKPSKADAVISWKQDHDQLRHPTSSADYFFNSDKVGNDTQGFFSVLKRIESLNDGATVRIDPVCIRTHGPFSDPVLMKGYRHFETTGEEPFRGLIDILADMAHRKCLQVEVIPDEGRTYHHPGGM
jgi:hypothetical protein